MKYLCLRWMLQRNTAKQQSSQSNQSVVYAQARCLRLRKHRIIRIPSN